MEIGINRRLVSLVTSGHGSTDEHFFPMGRSQNKVDCLMTVMDGCVLHDNFKTGEEVEKSRELRSLSRVTQRAREAVMKKKAE